MVNNTNECSKYRYFRKCIDILGDKIKLDEIIILVCVIFFNLVALEKGKPIEIYYDHLGMLAAPSKLAGYNWRDAIAMSNYYGPGYFILYTPLLMWIKNPLIIYNLIIDIYFIVLGVACIFLQRFIVEILDKRYRWISVICITIASNYIFQTKVVGAFGNESMIVLLSIVWIVILDKYFLTNNIIKKNICILILSVIIVYSLTVHVRNIIFLGGTIGIIIYDFMVRYNVNNIKKVRWTLFHMLLLSIIAIISYKIIPELFANLLFPDRIQGKMMINQELSIAPSEGINIFINNFLFQLIGNIVASVKQTNGLIIVSYYLLYKIIKNYVTNNYFSSNKNERIERMFLFSALCYWGGLIFTCIFWSDNPRGSGYWRYYGSYGLPMIVLSLLWIWIGGRIKAKEKIGIVIIISIMLKLFFVVCVPKLDIYFETWFIYPHLNKLDNKNIGFLYTFIIACLGAGILIFSVKRKICKYIVYFCIFYLTINYGGGSLLTYKESNICNVGHHVISELMDDNIVSKEDICFIGSDIPYLYYQFMIGKSKITRIYYSDNKVTDYYGNILDNIEKKVILSDKSAILPNEYYDVFQLDQNEYLYTRNKATTSAIIEVITNLE